MDGKQGLLTLGKPEAAKGSMLVKNEGREGFKQTQLCLLLFPL